MRAFLDVSEFLASAERLDHVGEILAGAPKTGVGVAEFGLMRPGSRVVSVDLDA